MTDSTLQQAAPVSSSSGKLAFKVFIWILALVVLSAAWFVLIASVAPARLDFSSLGASLMALTPPVLLTVLCWTGLRILSTPRSLAAGTPVGNVASPQATPLASVARFRIGAWSALTPHGNVIETVEGTKARTIVFKPDKAISNPSGYPVHASIVEALDLEAMGYRKGTRLRGPRVMTLISAILDDLHAQQPTLMESIAGPAHVYWLLPPALISAEDDQGDIFARAWNSSAWREGAYVLHMIRASEATAFMVLSSLQDGIDQSSVPYSIILAADSSLDREELSTALALGEVFSHTAPQGFIPSEAAGGVLLFNPAKTSDDLWANAAILGPVAARRRDADPQAERGVISAALTGAGKGAADICNVVSDSDHRTPGSMAVVEAMAHVLADMNPMEQRICPMEYAGAFGAASDLVHLALAVELAGEKSVLALSTCDGQCASVVVMPA
jgi:hypothetical protein